MARKSISTIVMEASSVSLVNTVKLHGHNTYTLSSGFISWDCENSYALHTIASTFGSRRAANPTEVVGSSRERGFTCGDATISAFDFGLLYSAFTAMLMAKVESGSSLPCVVEECTRVGLEVVWFGNDVVIYSASRNLILPIRNADVELACAGTAVKVQNFCGKDSYTFDLEGDCLALSSQDGSFLCLIQIPEWTRKSYSASFQVVARDAPDNSASWEDDSELGQLIEASDTRAQLTKTFTKYGMTPEVASVVSRTDLMIGLEQKYDDVANFFGSISYTDKGEIVVAVNVRMGLFVYYPWFGANGGEEKDIRTDPSADFSKFYNVTEGCNRILRFAGTVVNRPLTAAQFDIHMYEAVRKAFLSMSLPRIPVQASFGRIVVPESILARELTNGTGESIFCLLPVGVVGDKLICISSEGQLNAVTPVDWDLSSAFYDITEVAKSAEHRL